MTETPATRTVARRAALALLAFGLLTALALGAWLAREPDPWDWHAVVTLLSASVSLIAAGSMWRAPRRAWAAVGLGSMALSLIRIGIPTHFDWPLIALPLATGLLMVPVVRALAARA